MPTPWQPWQTTAVVRADACSDAGAIHADGRRYTIALHCWDLLRSARSPLRAFVLSTDERRGGVAIRDVQRDSLAARLGFANDDVIRSVNGHDVVDVISLVQAAVWSSAAQEITVNVTRELGSAHVLTYKLAGSPPAGEGCKPYGRLRAPGRPKKKLEPLSIGEGVVRLCGEPRKEPPMSKLRVHGFTISLDGYGAGPDQSLKEPLGVGGEELHPWLVTTHTFQKIYGKGGGTTGADDRWAAQGFENIGAWIMGRNMFAPSRGPWPDDGWKGWWGANPVYHAPVFVLTHHARADLAMEGGTTFHFVTDGITAALERAREAAGGRDVRLLGGAATIRQYLRAGLIDELHIAITPMLLGSGEPLFADLDATKLGYAVTDHEATQLATHVVLTKRA